MQVEKKRTTTNKSSDPNSTTRCFEIGAFFYNAINVDICCVSFKVRAFKNQKKIPGGKAQSYQLTKSVIFSFEMEAFCEIVLRRI